MTLFLSRTLLLLLSWVVMGIVGGCSTYTPDPRDAPSPVSHAVGPYLPSE